MGQKSIGKVNRFESENCRIFKDVFITRKRHGKIASLAMLRKEVKKSCVKPSEEILRCLLIWKALFGIKPNFQVFFNAFLEGQTLDTKDMKIFAFYKMLYSIGPHSLTNITSISRP